MKKNNLVNKALIIVCMLFITSTFAIPKDPCAPKDVCCEEPTPGPYAFSYPKDVGLSCPKEFNVHGEFLWMKPIEGGLDFALFQNDQGFATLFTFPLIDGQIKGFSSDSKEWDWRPGFRVGFGFNAMHDFWNFTADWTYIRIKATAEFTARPTGTFQPLFWPPTLSTVVPHASAKWSGDYNTLDLMIGKPYHVSRYFTSNPMFGIRTAFIDQDILARYSIEGRNEKNPVEIKNDYWGIGLRAFYEGQFIISTNWNIYAKTAFSLIFGKFDLSQHSNNAPVLTGSVQYDVEDSFYSVQPNSEVGLGLSWNSYLNKNQYLASLKVGYEFHQWWNQNQIRRFFNANTMGSDTVIDGDLTFNGFMFSLKLEF